MDIPRLHIGYLFVWAIILAIVESATKNSIRHAVLLVFLGWAFGWISATIARSVYPPRRHKVPSSTAAVYTEESVSLPE